MLIKTPRSNKKESYEIWGLPVPKGRGEYSVSILGEKKGQSGKQSPQIQKQFSHPIFVSLPLFIIGTCVRFYQMLTTCIVFFLLRVSPPIISLFFSIFIFSYMYYVVHMYLFNLPKFKSQTYCRSHNRHVCTCARRAHTFACAQKREIGCVPRCGWKPENWFLVVCT